MYNYSIDLKTKDAITSKEFLQELLSIRNVIIKDHQSLYVSEINSLINKVHLFGYNFAMLDIRQDSRIHHSVFTTVIDNLIEDLFIGKSPKTGKLNSKAKIKDVKLNKDTII